jgi:hypothetical protein
MSPKRLSEKVLREFPDAIGIDAATTLLYQAIRSCSVHGPFIRRVEEIMGEPLSGSASLSVAFSIVPGAFYQEHPETGASGEDLRNVAEAMGCSTYLVPTKSLGKIQENAAIILEWLLSSKEERIVLCSLSKGGADIKYAMAQPEAKKAFQRVVAWINVGGILSGSPMVTWLLARPLLTFIYRTLFWWRGEDFSFVRDLERRAGSTLDFDLMLPAHMKCVHVMCFPLARHIQKRRTRRWHRRLGHYGPNDGATLLKDSSILPGLLFPVWGVDHYFDQAERRLELVSALLYYLAEELELLSASTPLQGQNEAS